MSNSGAAKRLDIQGLRAVAVVAVILFHAKLPISGGYFGVDVFFVISGFVISLNYLAEPYLSRGFLMGFYKRRFFRLFPALAFMICVVLAASVFFISPFGLTDLTGQTALGATFAISNFVILRTSNGYFAHSSEMNPLLHTWSLSVEEQFYLVVPLVLALVFLAVSKRIQGKLRTIVLTVWVCCTLR